MRNNICFFGILLGLLVVLAPHAGADVTLEGSGSLSITEMPKNSLKTAVIGFNISTDTAEDLETVTVSITNVIGFDPAVDLAAMTNADTDGIAIYQDVGATGIGTFDSNDTRVVLNAVPAWAGATPFTITMTLLAGTNIPVNNTGVNEGNDFYVVIRTSANATAGDTFIVSLDSMTCSGGFTDPAPATVTDEIEIIQTATLNGVGKLTIENQGILPNSYQTAVIGINVHDEAIGGPGALQTVVVSFYPRGSTGFDATTDLLPIGDTRSSGLGAATGVAIYQDAGGIHAGYFNEADANAGPLDSDCTITGNNTVTIANMSDTVPADDSDGGYDYYLVIRTSSEIPGGTGWDEGRAQFRVQITDITCLNGEFATDAADPRNLPANLTDTITCEFAIVSLRPTGASRSMWYHPHNLSTLAYVWADGLPAGIGAIPEIMGLCARYREFGLNVAGPAGIQSDSTTYVSERLQHLEFLYEGETAGLFADHPAGPPAAMVVRDANNDGLYDRSDGVDGDSEANGHMGANPIFDVNNADPKTALNSTIEQTADGRIDYFILHSTEPNHTVALGTPLYGSRFTVKVDPIGGDGTGINFEYANQSQGLCRQTMFIRGGRVVFDVGGPIIGPDPPHAEFLPNPLVCFNMCDSEDIYDPHNEALQWIRLRFKGSNLGSGGAGEGFIPTDLAPMSDGADSGISLWEEDRDPANQGNPDREGVFNDRTGILGEFGEPVVLTDWTLAEKFLPLSADSLDWYNSDGTLWSPANDDPSHSGDGAGNEKEYFVVLKLKTEWQLLPDDYHNDDLGESTGSTPTLRGFDFYIAFRFNGTPEDGYDETLGGGSNPLTAYGRGVDAGDSVYAYIRDRNDILFAGGYHTTNSMWGSGTKRVGGMAYNTADSKLYGIIPADGIITINTADNAGTMVEFFAADTHGLACDPATGAQGTLYTCDNSEYVLYAFDVATGTFSLVGETTLLCYGLAYDTRNDVLYGTTEAQIYTINTATGAATALPFTIGGPEINSLAYDESTDVLYGWDYNASQLLVINKTSGRGVPVNVPVDNVIQDIQALAINPAGPTCYGISQGDAVEQLVEFDIGTGAGTDVGALGFAVVNGLAYGGGVLYGSDGTGGSEDLLTIDTDDGSGTSVGDMGAFDNVNSLAYIGGWVYGVDTVTDQLISINRSTGAGGAIGNLGFDNVKGLAYNGTTLYGLQQDANDVRLIRIDVTTGVGTPVGSLALDPDPGVTVGGLMWTGSSLYGTDTENGRLFIINETFAEATYVCLAGTLPAQPGIDGLSYDRPSQLCYGTDTFDDDLITVSVGTQEISDVAGCTAGLDMGTSTGTGISRGMRGTRVPAMSTILGPGAGTPGGNSIKIGEKFAAVGFNMIAPIYDSSGTLLAADEITTFDELHLIIKDYGPFDTAANFEFSDLVDPESDENDENGECGIAVYRDNPTAGTNGVFDPEDTRVRMDGLPYLIIETLRPYMRVNVIFDDSVGGFPEVPKNDLAENMGDDFFLVITPSSTMEAGDDFEIIGWQGTQYQSGVFVFGGEGAGISHARFTSGLLTCRDVSTAIFSDETPISGDINEITLTPAVGINVYDASATTTLNSIRLYFNSLPPVTGSNYPDPEVILMPIDGTTTTGLVIEVDGSPVSAGTTSWYSDYDDRYVDGDGTASVVAGARAPIATPQGTQLTWFVAGVDGDHVRWNDRDLDGQWTYSMDGLWLDTNDNRVYDVTESVIIMGEMVPGDAGIALQSGEYGFAYHDNLTADGAWTNTGTDGEDIYYVGRGRDTLGYYVDLTLLSPAALPVDDSDLRPDFYVEFLPNASGLLDGDKFSFSICYDGLTYNTGLSNASATLTTRDLTYDIDAVNFGIIDVTDGGIFTITGSGTAVGVTFTGSNSPWRTIAAPPGTYTISSDDTMFTQPVQDLAAGGAISWTGTPITPGSLGTITVTTESDTATYVVTGSGTAAGVTFVGVGTFSQTTTAIPGTYTISSDDTTFTPDTSQDLVAGGTISWTSSSGGQSGDELSPAGGGGGCFVGTSSGAVR